MSDCCKPLIVKPTSVVVVPGTTVTITLPTTLPATVGNCYTLVMDGLPNNITGKEEVVVVIGGTSMAGVDNCGVYITSQMLHNPGKHCPLDCNVFRIQIIAVDTAVTSVAFRRGLACRRTFIDVVTPPTP